MSPLTMVREMADVEQGALARLDADFHAQHGNETAWSERTRAVYIARVGAIHTAYQPFSDHHTPHHTPTRPRRASARRRHRRINRLPYQLHLLAPDAVRILATPIWTGMPGELHREFVVWAWAADDRRLRLSPGSATRIGCLLQAAYPPGDLDVSLTWHTTTNTVTALRPQPPRALGVA